MSQDKPDPSHGRLCECPSCRNAYFNSMGANFTDQQRQQVYGLGPVNARPGQGQVPQWQIDQGIAELQALANNFPSLEKWTSFNPDPTLKSLFLQDQAPAQHPYATELEISIPSKPPSVQPQGNAQRSLTRRPSIHRGNTRIPYDGLDRDALAGSHSHTGAHVRGTPAASSISEQQHNAHHRCDAMRNPSFQATVTRRVDRQSAAGRSRPAKQQSGRVLTPSSSEESDASM